MTPRERYEAQLCLSHSGEFKTMTRFIELVWGRPMTPVEQADLFGWRDIPAETAQ